MGDEGQAQLFSKKQAQRAMRRLVAALDEGRSVESVREFMQIVSSGIVPRNKRMVSWLVSVIGKQFTAQLVEAFVHYPCFYCKKGRTRCETCDARGHTESGKPCERCLGMRVERCDFCNGSGWVTIHYVPHGLEMLVIKERLRLAIRRMKAWLDLPLPRIRSRRTQAVIKRTGVMILNIDRQMGVFENMFLAAEHLRANAGRSAATIGPLTKRCVLLGAQAENRICELLRVIAEAHRSLAASLPRGNRDRKRFDQLAKHYESLVDPNRSLAGTGLTHPFLHEAINGVAGHKTERGSPKGTRP